jgi:ankyrin repeat protein
MLACYFNNIPLVRLLVAHEASLDIKSQTGWTAVDYARNLGGEVYRVILESAGLIPGTRLAQS